MKFQVSLDKCQLRAYTRIMKATSPCTCTNVRRAAQSITQFYDSILAPSGLKVTQFSLLREILLREHVSITQLSHAVDLDRTTTGKNLQVLARNHFVSFSAGEDRRERTVEITNTGRQAFNLALPLWEKAQATVKTALGKEHLDVLTSLLSTVETVSS